MQHDAESANVVGSFEEIIRSGPIEDLIMGHPAADNPVFGSGPGGRQARFDIGAAPFETFTESGRQPTADPDDIDLWGYLYTGVNRPGVRVRGGAMADFAQTYWRFVSPYTGQPGMSDEGDNPMDVKFQYLGGVLRTVEGNHYARYASLWVQLPLADDWMDGRVVAPRSEPLMRVGGSDVWLTTVLTLVKPGTVLEAGDRFGLAGQVGPTVRSTVEFTLTGPGFDRTWRATTNEIGGFFIPGSVVELTEPGVYTLDVAVTQGGRAGGLFQADSFQIPVVPATSGKPLSGLESGVVDGLAVSTKVAAPMGHVVRSLISTPGWILEETSDVGAGGAPVTVDLDVDELWATFKLLDRTTNLQTEAAIGDELVWVITTGDGADLRARRVVLIGPQLHAG